MGETIYVLCALLSAACAVLLIRQHAISPTGLAFWSGIGFAGLAVSNALLVADMIFLPAVNLALLRSGVALLSVVAMLIIFIWEAH